MKALHFIITLVSMALAIFALWMNQASQRKFQSHWAEAQDHVTQLEQQLISAKHSPKDPNRLAMDKGRLRNPSDRQAEEPTGNGALGEHVQNQRRANDNQWQEIDYLRSQRILHKRLIDQLTNELAKVRREGRETNQELELLKRNEIKRAEFSSLAVKIDELYRRINRGR